MMELKTRHVVKGQVVLESALHVGTGRPGRSGSDQGVMLTPGGRPLIPGSSLKGVLRSTAESLAGHLGMTACFLAPEGKCLTGKQQEESTFREWLKEDPSAGEIRQRLRANLCDACLLFGSPLAAGKVRMVDAVAERQVMPEIRDGVGLDRDARTAKPRIKFDFEVVPAGLRFDFRLDAENLEDREKALLWAALREWTRGFFVGGKVSRGLGAARLADLSWAEADLSDPGQRVAYLARGEMKELAAEDLDRFLEGVLAAGGTDA